MLFSQHISNHAHHQWLSRGSTWQTVLSDCDAATSEEEWAAVRSHLVPRLCALTCTDVAVLVSALEFWGVEERDFPMDVWHTFLVCDYASIENPFPTGTTPDRDPTAQNTDAPWWALNAFAKNKKKRLCRIARTAGHKNWTQFIAALSTLPCVEGYDDDEWTREDIQEAAYSFVTAAAKFGHIDALQLADATCAQRGQIHWNSSQSVAALEGALACDQKHSGRWMLDHGTSFSGTAICCAVRAGFLDVLVQHRASVISSSMPDYLPCLMREAAHCGNVHIMEFLWNLGDPRDENWSVTIWASRYFLSDVLLLQDSYSMDCVEFAWNHGCPRKNPGAARAAAKYARDDALQFVFEHASDLGIEWGDDQVCANAIRHGSMACLRLAHAHGCPLPENACDLAAQSGNVDCLRYVHEHGCEWTGDCIFHAVRQLNHSSHDMSLACMTYIYEHGGSWSEGVTEAAASNGNLACLKYAHEHGCPWDDRTVESAVQYNHLDCMQYALQHGAPAQCASFPKNWACLLALHEFTHRAKSVDGDCSSSTQ